MEYIYHYICADNILLAKPIIEEIQKNLKTPPFFILYYRDPKNKQIFVKLFKDLNFKDYIFVDNPRKNNIQEKLYYIFWSLLTRNFLSLRNILYNPRVSFLKNYPFTNILVHGEISGDNVEVRELCKLSKKIKVGWVCWGGLPKGDREFVRWFLGQSIRTKFIKSLDTIIALTLPEEKYIKNRYQKSKVFYLPYMLPQSDLGFCKDGNNVIIGNSGTYIDSYINLVDNLPKNEFGAYTFMLNYSIDKNNPKIFELAKKCEGCGVLNYKLWTDIVTKSEYDEVFKNHQVYICDAIRQTGLGAIEVCVNLGLKLYLNGVNYEYFKELGFVVYHTSELSNISEQEMFNYKEEYKIKNKSLFFHCFFPENIREEWDTILGNFYNGK